MKTVFYSPLSIDHCIKNLKTNTRKIILGSIGLSVLFNYWDLDKKYFVRFKGDNFRLERMYVRNSYAPIFIGKFTKINNNKTKIEGTIKRRVSPTVILIVWFSIVIPSACIAIIITITKLLKQQQLSPDTVISSLIPILLLIFGIYLTKAMIKQAQQWEKEMIAFIMKTLEAEMSDNKNNYDK